MRRPAILVGLVGEGVTPSLTPPMHELEGARHGMHYVYRPIDITPGEANERELGALLASAQRLGFTGLNITHPVKQVVVPLLDELAPSAQRVGAVNTVVFDGDRLIGHNTDVSGFEWAFAQHLGDAPRERVVLIGAGGAGSAVAAALAAQGVAELTIVDVDAERATRLAESTHVAAAGDARVRGTSVAHLNDLLAVADGVVNATPFGMAAHPGAACDVSLLSDTAWVADIVYRPTDTALLQAARARGLRTMSGLGMAMAQAADSFEIFTGASADRSAMLTDLDALVRAEDIIPVSA